MIKYDILAHHSCHMMIIILSLDDYNMMIIYHHIIMEQKGVFIKDPTYANLLGPVILIPLNLSFAHLYLVLFL